MENGGIQRLARGGNVVTVVWSSCHVTGLGRGPSARHGPRTDRYINLGLALIKT